MASFEKLHILGAWRITLPSFTDERGYFQEIIHKVKYPAEIQPEAGISQVSISYSVRDTLRGMHLSKYSKHVTVLHGKICDVMCDLRADSPTFRRWAIVELSQDNKQQVFIPPGVAHGFYCSENSTVLYLQGGIFNPPEEVDLNPFDTHLGILWPKPNVSYIMSKKDQESQNFITLHPTYSKLPPLRRILVIGANGQVGRAIVELYGQCNVIGTFNSHAESNLLELNLFGLKNETQRLRNMIESIRPEVVFICAGFTWVDGCESEPGKALDINANSPAIIAAMVKQNGGKTVYYSTDYVFNGRENKLWSEDDEVNPINVYGRSKAEGEKSLIEADPDALIIRTTGVFGPDKYEKNFVYQLCEKISSGSNFKCVLDQFGCPTYSRDLAEWSSKLLESEKVGIFHCVGPETLDRYSFAILLADFFNLPKDRILPSTTSELYAEMETKLAKPARRGAHLGLSTKKLEETVSVRIRCDISSALAHWKEFPGGLSLPKRGKNQ